MSGPAPLDALAAHPLAMADWWPARPFDEPTWQQILSEAIRNRLTPALSAAIEDGTIAATPAQRTEAVAAHAETMRACIRLERVLLEIVDLFEAEAIPYRALKGSAVAHLDYASPSERAFGDVDVLVSSDRYDDAVAALEAGGARRRYAEVQPGFDRRYGKGVCMVRADSYQIDVHRTLASGPFGITIDREDLFAAPTSFALGGRQVLAPSREVRFLHACIHAVLGDASPRPTTLRDVARLSRAPELDPAAVIRIATHWRADAIVAAALRAATERLELDAGRFGEWTRHHVADEFQRRSLRAYAGPNRSYAAQAAAGLAALPTVPAKVSYATALLLATPAHVARHDGGYRRRFQRAWHAARVTRGAST